MTLVQELAFDLPDHSHRSTRPGSVPEPILPVAPVDTSFALPG